MPGGGNDSYTYLLLPFEDSDGATGTPGMDDVSHAGNGGSTHGTATVNNDAQIDTAQYKFGSSSLYNGEVTGGADYIYFGDHADWFPGSGKFTLDFHVRFNDISANRGFFEVREDNDNYWAFRWTQSSEELYASWKDNTGPTTAVIGGGSWSPSTGTWYHLALIRGWGGNANDWAICVDGTAVHTETDTQSWYDLGTVQCFVGICLGYGGNSDHTWFDNVRYSKGIARWESNFTAPPRAYGKIKANGVTVPAKVCGVGVEYIMSVNQ